MKWEGMTFDPPLTADEETFLAQQSCDADETHDIRRFIADYRGGAW